MTPTQQLMHATIRIQTFSPQGHGSGTGFFIAFDVPEDPDAYLPLLITNKHVIKDATSIVLDYTLSNQDDYSPNYGKLLKIEMASGNRGWIHHPDENVDLVAFPTQDMLQQNRAKGLSPYSITIPEETIASADYLKALNPVENIIMVGYPIGLSDEKNNLPLFRRGITATDPSKDFNGNSEFMIDCACFPGSSGSPVFLYDSPAYIGSDGSVKFGMRAALIGILTSGPQHNAVGSLYQAPIPMTTSGSIATKVMINLGYCVKSSELFWFKDEILRQNRASLQQR